MDYSEDKVLPCGGEAKLVSKYADLMKMSNKEISVYSSKEEMLMDVLEWAHQAREGCGRYVEFLDDEMREKIEDIERRLEAKKDIMIQTVRRDYELSVVELAGQRIKDMYGYITKEFGEPVLKITRMEMEDGKIVNIEGEHDLPYICDEGKVVPLPEE